MAKPPRLLLVSPSDLEAELEPTGVCREDVERVSLHELEPALDKVAEFRPRLVVLDWPDPEAVLLWIEELRAMPSTQAAGVAVLSRGLSAHQERQMRVAGANVVIPVPLSPEIWSGRLQSLLFVPPRRSMRTPVNVAVWTQPESSADAEMRGLALNIGAHGLMLETDRPLPIGYKAELRFHLPGQEEEVRAVGDVVWREESPPRRYRSGLEFAVLRGESRDKISRFVEEPGSGGGQGNELKEWERALRASEARKRAILDSSPEATVTVDLQGRILEFNHAAERTFGHRRSNALGCDAAELLAPPEQRDRLQEAFRDYLVAHEGLPESVTVESHGLHKDGTEIPLELTASPMLVSGKLLVTVFARDLTQRRQAEAAAHRLERQVLQKQKLESLGVLASGVAHDLNNLLVGMLGHADLARVELGTDSTALPDLEGIVMAATRASELCEQLLAYGGKSQVEEEPTDLNLVIREMVSLIEVSILRRAEIVYELTPSLPLLDADPIQLRQVILNLVTNAVEAIEEPRGRIRIATGVADRDRADLDRGVGADELVPGRYLHVEIEDSGPGIPPEVQGRIFDPFFTTKLEGRGLGLAAVLGIVRSHRGAIQVESPLDRGCCMRVLLPVAEATEIVERATPEPDTRRLSGTVLVVDDESMVRHVAERMLKRAGMKVEPAEDGTRAVELFAADPDRYRCVLLDMHMPNMGGRETFRRLREIRPELPVVFSSGFGGETVLEHIDDEPRTTFVKKPYRIEVLLEALRGLLRSAS